MVKGTSSQHRYLEAKGSDQAYVERGETKVILLTQADATSERDSSPAKRNVSPSKVQNADASKRFSSPTKRNASPSKVPKADASQRFSSPTKRDAAPAKSKLQKEYPSSTKKNVSNTKSKFKKRNPPPSKAKLVDISRKYASPPKPEIEDTDIDVVERVSRMVKKTNAVTKGRSQTAPKERRNHTSTRERSTTALPKQRKTGLEACLENLEGTRAFHDEFYPNIPANDSASVSTTESSIAEAKEQYQRALSQRREVTKIYSEDEDEDENNGARLESRCDDEVNAANLVSLHVEDRCEGVIVAATKSLTKERSRKEKALEPSEEKIGSIFRDESSSKSDSPQEDEGIAEPVEKEEKNEITSKESALVIFIKDEGVRKSKKEAGAKKEEEGKKKAKEAEEEEKPTELQKKQDEYEAKMHTLFKYLKKPSDDMPKKEVVVNNEIKNDEASADGQMPPTGEIEIKSSQAEGGLGSFESDISYDEDHVSTKESTESLGREDRNEAPTKLRPLPQVQVPRSSNSAERQQAEKRETSSQVDCSNLCFWFIGDLGEEEEKTREAERMTEQQTPVLEQTPEEKERDREEEHKELVADLARSMAMDVVMPTTMEQGGGEDESVYGDLDISAIRSQKMRMENAARRSIATKVLTESLLNGYTTVGSRHESTPCSECGMPLLSSGSEVECVVCPALGSDLEKVTKGLLLQDPHFQQKIALEAKIKALNKEAKEKTRVAEEARGNENALLEKKQAAAEKLSAAEEATSDAEIEALWRTKEVKKIRTAAKGASQKARSSIEIALQDKAEAKRKAKENIVAAENARLKADHLHLSSIKEEVLAELKVFVADDEVRRAVEARDRAIVEFKGMKRCVAQLKADHDTKQVEKAWAIAGTSMLLSRKETDIKIRQATREEAELKAVALCNSAVYEQDQAKVAVEAARKTLAEAEAEFSAVEETVQSVQEKRMALENEADEALALAGAKTRELKDAVTKYDAVITSERSKLEATLGDDRTDAIEQAAWDAQAQQLFKAKDNTVRKVEQAVDEDLEVNTEEETRDLGDKDQVDEKEGDALPELPVVGVTMEQDDTADDDSLQGSLVSDSWNYYREICGLVSCRWKYDEAFRKVQLDPLYPYLASLAEMDAEEEISQKVESSYEDMTMSEVGRDLTKKAKEAKPVLLEICKELAKKLKISKIGVGPIKDINSAIEKADNKYDGNLLRVTDFCRAFIVVKDIATLLALFEVLVESMAPLVRRIKFSALKNDQEALPGGYRDCKITLLVKEHLCEIQVHLSTMWSVSKLLGYAHYQKSKDYSIEMIKDPYTALNGLDEKTLSKLVSIGEKAAVDTPIESLKFGDEEHIIDFFASAGIYMQLNEAAKAEAILLKLATLRSRTPGMGSLHNETLYLKKHLESALRDQDMTEEADMIAEQLAEAERRFKDEAEDASASLWQFLYVDANEARDLIIDPDKKGRAHDEKVEEEASAAKKQWIQSREKRFKVLKKCKVADAALSNLNRSV